MVNTLELGQEIGGKRNQSSKKFTNGYYNKRDNSTKLPINSYNTFGE